MRNTWIWIVIVVIVAVGGFLWWQSMQAPATTTPTPETSDINPAAGTVLEGTDTGVDSGMVGGDAANPATTITFDGASFSPAELSVAVGTTVTFVNDSGDDMWVATGPHPAHTGYDSTSRDAHCISGYAGPIPFDQCESTKSYSFKFEKAGTWPYHNHIGGKQFGKIIVL